MFRRTAKPRAYHVVARTGAKMADLTYTTNAGPLTVTDLGLVRDAFKTMFREADPHVLVEPSVIITNIFELEV